MTKSSPSTLLFLLIPVLYLSAFPLCLLGNHVRCSGPWDDIFPYFQQRGEGAEAFKFFVLLCQAVGHERSYFPNQGIEPIPCAVEAQSPNHWNTRKAPLRCVFFFFFFLRVIIYLWLSWISIAACRPSPVGVSGVFLSSFGAWASHCSGFFFVVGHGSRVLAQ